MQGRSRQSVIVHGTLFLLVANIEGSASSKVGGEAPHSEPWEDEAIDEAKRQHCHHVLKVVLVNALGDREA